MRVIALDNCADAQTALTRLTGKLPGQHFIAQAQREFAAAGCPDFFASGTCMVRSPAKTDRKPRNTIIADGARKFQGRDTVKKEKVRSIAFIAVFLILLLLPLGVMGYKLYVLGYPLAGLIPAVSYRVDLSMQVDGHGEDISVSTYLPKTDGRQTISDEQKHLGAFASPYSPTAKIASQRGRRKTSSASTPSSIPSTCGRSTCGSNPAEYGDSAVLSERVRRESRRDTGHPGERPPG
jgi:hypothetical protein